MNIESLKHYCYACFGKGQHSHIHNYECYDYFDTPKQILFCDIEYDECPMCEGTKQMFYGCELIEENNEPFIKINGTKFKIGEQVK
jgi:hypothetical protein